MSGNFRPARTAQQSGGCLNRVLGENALAVKMQPTRSKTKRPRGALLQFDIGVLLRLFRIGGSFGAREIPPLRCGAPNLMPVSLALETVSDRQFNWGGCLPNCNGGVYQGQLAWDRNPGGRTNA